MWTIPIFVSSYIVFTVKENSVLFGFSYVPIIVMSLLFFHYLNGLIGGTIDFVGYSGLKALFPIVLIASLITCGIGTFLGIVLKTIFK